MPTTQTRSSDTIALIATEPEHCLDWFRLICPGETYHQGKGRTVLCPMCVSDLLVGEDFGTVQATDQVAVDYGGGLIRLRREGAAIVVLADKCHPLTDRLVSPKNPKGLFIVSEGSSKG